MSGLGRIFKPDDRDWTLRSAGIEPIAQAAAIPTTRYWPASKLPLDQGSSPMCVGYASKGMLLAGPVYNTGGPDAPTIYHNAQLLDETPGENYDGTTPRGAMRYLQSIGYVSAYVWPRTLEEALTMLQTGPIMVGVNWYSSFDNPGTSGVLNISANASIRGGHEFLLLGYTLTYQRFRMMNSWGRGWAQYGRAWLPFSVFTRLLSEDGDCTAPTEVLKP